MIDSKEGAARLGAEILDPERTTPLVGVSLAPGRQDPLVDLPLLRAGLAGRAAVHVLATGEATWELKRVLPPGLDVYGDAMRVWQPGVRAGAAPDHPLVLFDGSVDAAAVVRQALELVDRGTHRERAAVVSDVGPDRARLQLTDGTAVVVPRAEITAAGLAADRVLRPAQTVRVLVVGDPGGGEAASGSMLPFEPDPRRRFAEAHGVGSLLLGRVSGVHPFGAFVELLPGLVGLVRVARIAEHWVSDPRDELNTGELVAVRVVATEGDRIELSLRGTDRGDTDREAPVVAASLYDDGPPWLDAPPPAVELPALPDHDEAVVAWEAPEPGVGRDGSDPFAEVTELERLEDVVLRAAEMHERSRRLISESAGQLAHLRSEAARLRHELETDLLQLRDRVLRAVEQEHGDLQGSTQDALEAARNENRRLRALLTEAGREHDELEQQMQATGEQARQNGEALRKVAADAERQRTRARRLERELETFVSAEQRLVAAIRGSWLRNTTAADRESFRWREPVLGREFLDSLDRLEGVSRERVVDVCAEVVSGRAVTRTGLQVHALRSTQAGGGPQRTRADGARAYRASLQVRSAAARRLHYWELPDGGIELAKVGYHDDFTIS